MNIMHVLVLSRVGISPITIWDHFLTFSEYSGTVLLSCGRGRVWEERHDKCHVGPLSQSVSWDCSTHPRRSRKAVEGIRRVLGLWARRAHCTSAERLMPHRTKRLMESKAVVKSKKTKKRRKKCVRVRALCMFLILLGGPESSGASYRFL